MMLNPTEKNIRPAWTAYREFGHSSKDKDGVLGHAMDFAKKHKNDKDVQDFLLSGKAL